MSDLMDKVWKAYWGDDFELARHTTYGHWPHEAMEAVVSLVIDEAAKVADDRGDAIGNVNGSMAQHHCYAIGKGIRSLLNKGE